MLEMCVGGQQDDQSRPKGRPPSSIPVSIARRLRRRLTPQEAKLWVKLRALRPAGLHFRRQVPIDVYVVDFACLPHRLIVEADGGQHSRDLDTAADRVRDGCLGQLGFHVQRFWNAEIDTNLDGVVETILARVRLRGEPPTLERIGAGEAVR